MAQCVTISRNSSRPEMLTIPIEEFLERHCFQNCVNCRGFTQYCTTRGSTYPTWRPQTILAKAVLKKPNGAHSCRVLKKQFMTTFGVFLYSGDIA